MYHEDLTDMYTHPNVTLLLFLHIHTRIASYFFSSLGRPARTNLSLIRLSLYGIRGSLVTWVRRIDLCRVHNAPQ